MSAVPNSSKPKDFINGLHQMHYVKKQDLQQENSRHLNGTLTALTDK